MKTALCLALVLAFTAMSSRLSAQWATLSSEEEQLKGKTIVDVGKISHEEKMIGEASPSYDTRLKRYVFHDGRRTDWREFHGNSTLCFEDLLGTGFGRDEAVLLMVDASNRLFLATVSSSLSSISVKVEIAPQIPCPR